MVRTFLAAVLCIFIESNVALSGGLFLVASVTETGSVASSAAGSPAVPTLRLTLDEAISLFLRHNLDLLMAEYGIEASKGREVT
ncbi:MAG: hypothetical protein CV090_16450, partial [Nitrospira sp. WS238]|nr:hypothetical protein [Nitrospira sp. WS238]